MTLQAAILGFLNREELSGYDLKRKFSREMYVHWSGNNNQIYRTLTALRRDGFVTVTLQPPDKGPSRKLYSITDLGRSALRSWLLAEPELPQIRNPFMARLSMVELLSDADVRKLLGDYRRMVETELLVSREHSRRATPAGDDSSRSALLQSMIRRRWIEYYEGELAWTQSLERALSSIK